MSRLIFSDFFLNVRLLSIAVMIGILRANTAYIYLSKQNNIFPYIVHTMLIWHICSNYSGQTVQTLIKLLL